MTQFAEVIEWIRQAKAGRQNTHLLIVEQSGTNMHYPVFVRFGDNLQEKISSYNAGSNRVSEVIDLNDAKVAHIR